MRKRINRAAICSSENYKDSRNIHHEYLREEHKKNSIILQEITTIKKSYIKVFGKLIPISEEELRIHNTLIAVQY